MDESELRIVDSEILDFYEKYDEQGRLARGSGILEIARMRELIGRFLPPPPQVVLDVGGGPGRYSCWLASMGHKVHLIDPVEKHIEQARAASEAQPLHPLKSVVQGDARSLDHSDGSADAVLLMGPLYHLPGRQQRQAALREAHRVMRPGGLLIAKAINRLDSLVEGLRNCYIDDPVYASILSRGLNHGHHSTPPGEHRYFTTAFFHRPEELEDEVRDAGFTQRGLYSVQGPGELVPDLKDRMSDPAKRAQLLDLIRSVEEEITLLGVASHFVVVATN